MNPCGNKWNLKSISWLNPKCSISGCPSVSEHRMPSCADAVHSRCGHGRGRNAFLPGEVTIYPGRHHTKPLQKDLKEHHVDTRQGAWCQGQTPRAGVRKSCSSEAVYRRMGPSCIRTILAIPIRKTMSTVQGIRPCCSYLHELFLEIKYTTLLWHIPRDKKSQLIFNAYTPAPSFSTSVTSLTKRWTRFLR